MYRADEVSGHIRRFIRTGHVMASPTRVLLSRTAHRRAPGSGTDKFRERCGGAFEQNRPISYRGVSGPLSSLTHPTQNRTSAALVLVTVLGIVAQCAKDVPEMSRILSPASHKLVSGR